MNAFLLSMLATVAFWICIIIAFRLGMRAERMMAPIRSKAWATELKRQDAVWASFERRCPQLFEDIVIGPSKET